LGGIETKKCEAMQFNEIKPVPNHHLPQLSSSVRNFALLLVLKECKVYKKVAMASLPTTLLCSLESESEFYKESWMEVIIFLHTRSFSALLSSDWEGFFSSTIGGEGFFSSATGEGFFSSTTGVEGFFSSTTCGDGLISSTTGDGFFSSTATGFGVSFSSTVEASGSGAATGVGGKASFSSACVGVGGVDSFSSKVDWGMGSISFLLKQL
jgi:hypothetical protein